MFQNDIEKAIESVMPTGVEILLNPDVTHYEAHISWLLNNEESRPSKRSRTIILKVCRETVDDYPALSDATKKIIINNMILYLKEKHEVFISEDKDGVLALFEVWRIDADMVGMLD